MRYLFLLLLIGCGSGTSGDSASSDLVPPVGGTPINLTIKDGNGFSCFVYDKSVYCEGVNVLVGINSVNYIEVFESQSVVTDLVTYDDTVCFTTSVGVRPVSTTAGVATYCLGEATLNGAYAGFPIRYAGPSFSVLDMSPELIYSILPMMGGDIVMNQVVNETYVTDGTGFVNQANELCLLDAGVITCSGFMVTL